MSPQLEFGRTAAQDAAMSKGFKICLVALAAYALFMGVALWDEISFGSLAAGGAPLYLGLLFALLHRRKNARR